MTWYNLRPTVERVTTLYKTGVRLAKSAMVVVEAHVVRLPQLEGWFVTIAPSTHSG
jgi:hypothetical protein